MTPPQEPVTRYSLMREGKVEHTRRHFASLYHRRSIKKFQVTLKEAFSPLA